VHERRAPLAVDVDDVGVRRDAAEQADERTVAGGAGRDVDLAECALRPAARERERHDAEVAHDVPRKAGGAAEPARVEPEAVEAEPREQRAGPDGEPRCDRAGDRGLRRRLADVELPQAEEHGPPEDDPHGC
jgi:hypothetical protein